MTDDGRERLSPETLAVTAGRPAPEPGAPLNTPIVPVSSFHAGGPWSYAREGAPTTDALEQAIGALEHGTAIVYASGMAAANAVLDLVPVGGLVVAPNSAYSGVSVRLRELHESGRIALRPVDIENTAAVTGACAGAALLWVESPTNPLLEVADLPAVIAGAHRAGTRVVVDNTFATPILQQPLADGADIVLHSVSKSLSGHSDLLLGALVASDPDLAAVLRERRVLLGASPSPFECFLALRGIRTLALRVDRAQESARVLADRLAVHAFVSTVRYPGFGSMIAIEHAGGADAAEASCAAVRLWTHATSLGGVESLLERRRRWPGESDRVPESLIRLSVGIENVDELWADLDQALSRR